jgi:hypothetical protein
LLRTRPSKIGKAKMYIHEKISKRERESKEVMFLCLVINIYDENEKAFRLAFFTKRVGGKKIIQKKH